MITVQYLMEKSNYFRAMDFNHLADEFQTIANDFSNICEELQKSQNQLTELKNNLITAQERIKVLEENIKNENCTKECVCEGAGGEDDRGSGDRSGVVEDGISMAEGERVPN